MDRSRWPFVGERRRSTSLLFRAPDVLRLNDDHSLGAYLDDQVRRKQIVPAEAKNNPYRNALRSALTGKALDLVDLHGEPYKLAAGDWVILASDGIMTLEGDEIGDIVYANREESPEVMAERLIAAVEEKQEPDQDNTTVVVLRIDEDPDASLAEEQPTRVLRPELRRAAGADEEGVATTQRIVQPPAIYSMFRRHRSLIVGLGMGIMFLIGWGVRALLRLGAATRLARSYRPSSLCAATSGLTRPERTSSARPSTSRPLSSFTRRATMSAAARAIR